MTYIDYFLFLRYYFGSSSLCVQGSVAVVNEPSLEDRFFAALDNLNPWDRFVKLVTSQSKDIFFLYDTNKNGVFELD